MSRNPVRIQLAIQGGAAKLCVLIGALEAIQDLQNRGELKVTRIAGTSAGAIAATLFAAKVPMSTVKAHLRKVKLADIVPRRTLAVSIFRFARGKALWSDSGLQKLIELLVRDCPENVTTFSDIERVSGVPVQVIATDIRNGETKLFGKGDQIVNAVLDSCAVPFGFRAACSGGDSSIVDGGICENLPADILAQHVAESGPVVGICFKKVPGRTPQNAISFAMSLLDAAMNNSVHRAKRTLSSFFEIDTSVGSFDWETALSSGLDAEYEKTKLQAEKYFSAFVKKYHDEEDKAATAELERKRVQAEVEENAKRHQGQVLSDEWAAAENGDFWAKHYQRAMIATHEMFRAQHSTSKINFEYCELVVTAWSLLPPGQSHASDFDVIRHKGIFRTLEDPLYCHSIGLSSADHETLLIKSKYQVLDPDKKEIDTIRLAMSDGARNDRSLLLCFNPIIQPRSGPYEFRFVDEVKNFLQTLKDQGEDDLEISVRRAHEAVGRIHIALYAPNNFPTLRMAPRAGPHIGRAMNDQELQPYKEYEPIGFRTLGWVGEKIPAGYNFGVKLYR